MSTRDLRRNSSMLDRLVDRALRILSRRLTDFSGVVGEVGLRSAPMGDGNGKATWWIVYGDDEI